MQSVYSCGRALRNMHKDIVNKNAYIFITSLNMQHSSTVTPSEET